MISIPFSGSKRFSYKDVKEIVENGGYKRVYEPFGGSCVLSVNLVNEGVVEYAVANDYDHFFDDYEKYLDLKDKVVEEGYKRGLRRTATAPSYGKLKYVRFELDGSTTEIKSKTLNNSDKKVLQNIITEYVPTRFWKYFALGNNFTFSAVSSHKEIKLNDFSLFNAYLKTDKQRKYLDALRKIKLENLDYKDFLEKYSWNIQNDKESLLIVDPPYIGAEQDQYKGGFSVSQTKELLNILDELNVDFIFFNHDPNITSELLNGFDFEIELTGDASITANRKRKDVMAYVKRNKN